MTDSGSPNIDSVTKRETSPTPDTPSEDVPTPALRAAAAVYAFITDDQQFATSAELADELDDTLVRLAEACATWADESGHEGFSREAHRADSYIEMLERVLTSLALDSRIGGGQ